MVIYAPTAAQNPSIAQRPFMRSALVSWSTGSITSICGSEAKTFCLPLSSVVTVAEEGKPLMLSTIKKAVYETETTDSEKQLADIAVEISPGFYAQNLTIPVELLEFAISSADARGTQKDPTNDANNEVTLKPEEAETKTPDVGQSTHVPDGDYKLNTAKYLNA